MQVIDCLPTMFPGVDDYTISPAKAVLLCEIGRDTHQVTDQFMLVVRLIERLDVLARNDEQMCRRLRRDVGKGKGALVLVHGLRLDDAGNNFAEDAIHSVTSVHVRFQTAADGTNSD